MGGNGEMRVFAGCCYQGKTKLIRSFCKCKQIAIKKREIFFPLEINKLYA